MKHIFISYSREDIGVVRRLREDLSNNHLQVWLDEFLEPGSNSWKDAIQKAIDEAGCLMVILSPTAKASRWVKEELSYAEAQNITIFPVLASGDESNAVPFGLVTAQWIDIREAADYDLEIQKLILALHKFLNAHGEKQSSFDEGYEITAAGNLIREARKNLNMSHLQVADLLGLTTRHIHRLEMGREVPDRKLAKSLCKTLQVDFKALMDACMQDEINRIKLKYWVPED